MNSDEDAPPEVKTQGWHLKFRTLPSQLMSFSNWEAVNSLLWLHSLPIPGQDHERLPPPDPNPAGPNVFTLAFHVKAEWLHQMEQIQI